MVKWLYDGQYDDLQQTLLLHNQFYIVSEYTKSNELRLS